ncbi:MAG TPA: hypothetical protein DCW31_00070 [Lactobacillus sp.]|nr:hypothetical protein [Lactobacillus sp.]
MITLSKQELRQHLDAVQRRLVIAAVLALGLLVVRLFLINTLIIVAFWACGLYVLILFGLWLWLEWQLLFRH